MNLFQAVAALSRCAVIACALSLPVLANAAGETKVTVNVTVLKNTSLAILSQPGAVTITPVDIARGYVDVPAPAQLAVRSNTPYLLEFSCHGEFMKQILVRGLGADLQLSAEGGALAQPAGQGGVTRSTLTLGFRLLLAESSQEGTYPWPLRISASPL